MAGGRRISCLGCHEITNPEKGLEVHRNHLQVARDFREDFSSVRRVHQLRRPFSMQR
jgi:hypothetical protein